MKEPRRRPWDRIGVRVAAAAGLVAALLLTAGALAFRAAVHARQIDATAELANVEAAEIINLTQQGVQVTGSFGPLPFELIRSDGTVISATNDLTALQQRGWTPPLPEPTAEPLVNVRINQDVPPQASVAWSGGSVVTVTSTIQGNQISARGEGSHLADQHAYRVYVFATSEQADAVVAAMDPFLWGGVALACLLVAATAAATIRLALRPVETMRREAARITSATDDARLSLPARRDELSDLARTLDTMLGRIHASFEAQRRFTADAAHELRGPLATVRASAEIALEHPGDVDAGAALRHVLAETDRLQDLTEQLLTLARAGATAAAPPEADVSRVVSAVLASYPAGIAARIAIADRCQGVPAPAAIATGDLHRVVRNLLDNAIRHATADVSLTVDDLGESIRLAVSNDGEPIPRERWDEIFEPFVRLDDARARDDGGTGLGLTIVRDLVAAAGGRVEVASDEHRTTFAVHLPRPEASAPRG